MARGIYKRTMHRGHFGKSEAADAEERPHGVATGETGAQALQQHENDARPLVGNRSLYVDRMVKRRSRGRSKTKQIRRLKTLVATLVLCLAFVAMGLVISWASVQRAEDRSVALEADLRNLSLELDDVRVRLEKRDKEILELVEHRTPDLKPLRYNESLQVNDRYLANVTFSESGVGEKKALEYHALLVNSDDKTVLPRATIFVFDEFGLQVGSAKLERAHATSALVSEDLLPGETRSYHSNIELERDAAAMFYMIYVE
jgi:hypothetical protein